MRPRRHWTPRYVVNRLGVTYDQWRNPDAPWLSAMARELLAEWLKPGDVGIEWGSGRSTIWFAGRVRRLVSVEHDPEWYGRVRRQLDERALANVDYYLRPIDESSLRPVARYLLEGSGEEVPPLDFALVDGVVRDACTVRAMVLLKPGGLLAIDNANWYLPHQTRSPASLPAHAKPATRWEAIAHDLQGWRSMWASNGVTDTAFFVKPV